MRRRQLVEIEDLPWCPAAVRDGATDWLRFMADTPGVYRLLAPKLRAAMQACGTSRIIDLCSGGGGPWRSLSAELQKSGPVEIVLSDLHPNMDAFGDAQRHGDGCITFEARSIDAAHVPDDAIGMRTIFNAFHHFPPVVARAILQDAIARRQGIAIFEGINHRAAGIAAVVLQMPALFLFTPFIRPFRWSRLLFTYVLPLIPVVILWDGVVSMLRLYLREDVHELLQNVAGHDTFQWDIGTATLGRIPLGMPCIIGVPRSEPSDSASPH